MIPSFETENEYRVEDTWTRLVVQSLSFGVRFPLNTTAVSAAEKFCDPVEFIKFLWTSESFTVKMGNCISDLPPGLLYGSKVGRQVKHFAEVMVKNNYYKNVNCCYGDNYESSGKLKEISQQNGVNLISLH